MVGTTISVGSAGVVPKAPSARRRRRPSHTFALRTRPYLLQPFLLAPVLPGETLDNLLLQSRVVTDPVKNPLIGWHKEYYFFYVKHSQLSASDNLMDMMLDPSLSASVDADGDVPTYTFPGGVPYAQMCLDRIAQDFFRDEDEAATTMDGLPVVTATIDSWLESARLDSVDETELDLAFQQLDDEVIPGMETEYEQWMRMRKMKLTDLDYDDYLRSAGVRIPKKEEVIKANKPELIRYIRDWTYPSNTVDPATGTPSSALSWSIAERADKARYLDNPGFIFGVTVARPKIYMSKQTGSAAGLMKDALSWLPPTLADAAYSSILEITAGTGPLAGQTADYWIDLKDLLLYGDQFTNIALTETDAGFVALPADNMQKHYPSSAMINALFVDSDGSAGRNLIREDGRVDLGIRGRIVETT